MSRVLYSMNHEKQNWKECGGQHRFKAKDAGGKLLASIDDHRVDYGYRRPPLWYQARTIQDSFGAALWNNVSWVRIRSLERIPDRPRAEPAPVFKELLNKNQCLTLTQLNKATKRAMALEAGFGCYRWSYVPPADPNHPTITQPHHNRWLTE